ncbi:MAG: TonB-dependent receptor, partial [Planctomycetota bacterium]|nr:TonB-dependent receptor [Planctomycetota bacterium]
MRNLLIAAVALMLVSGVNADKSETKKKDPLAGIKCPVSGKPVKADKTAEYKGAKVYFCCPGCPAPFAKDTEKFANKANHQLVATGQFVQTKCPITGKDMDKSKSAKVLHQILASVSLSQEPTIDPAASATQKAPVAEPPQPPVLPPTTVLGSASVNVPADNPRVADRRFGPSTSEFGRNTGVLRNRLSLFDSSASGSIIGRDQIVEKQAIDMFHSLQNEVGVLLQRTAIGQASPFIRGLTGQQVLILIDGIRLNNSFFRRGPNQYFNTIDPGLVERIEVVRGQGSVLWGSDAIGGVINIVTRSPNSHRGQFHGGYTGAEFHETFNTADSSSYSRINVDGWTGESGFFGGGSYLNVRDLDTGFDFGRQPGTNYSQYSGDVKFQRLLGDDQLLTVAVQHHEQQDVPRADRFPGFPGDRNNSNTPGGARSFDPQQRDLAYMRYEALQPIDAIDAVTFTASYHRQREVQTRGIPTTRTQETDVESVGVNLVAVRDFDGFGKISSGVDWYHDDVDSAFGGTAGGVIIPDDAYYARFGTYVNWDVAVTERLDATAGVRYETINTAGTPIIANTAVPVRAHYQGWVGQVGLVYKLTPEVHLVGSISEGFRAPNLDDLMANNPNVLQQGQSV